MAVSRRGRARIVIDNCNYFWQVLPKYDPNDHFPVLTVVSDDKQLLLYYPLSERRLPELLEFVDSMNYPAPPIPEPLHQKTGDHNVGFGKSDFVITPFFVRRLVMWARENDIDRIPNNWR